MRNFKKYIMLFILLLISAILIACNSKTETTADSKFFYSTDYGITYQQTSRIFEVDETIFFMIVMDVLSSDKNSNEVTFTVKIPNLEGMQIYYLNGPIPAINTIDDEGNTHMYTFNIISSGTTTSQSFLFQLTSTVPNELLVKIEFDDRIMSVFDKQTVISFS